MTENIWAEGWVILFSQSGLLHGNALTLKTKYPFHNNAATDTDYTTLPETVTSCAELAELRWISAQDAMVHSPCPEHCYTHFMMVTDAENDCSLIVQAN